MGGRVGVDARDGRSVHAGGSGESFYPTIAMPSVRSTARGGAGDAVAVEATVDGCLNDWTARRGVIGRGSSAVVTATWHARLGTVAVKRVRVDDSTMETQAKKEAATLRKMMSGRRSSSSPCAIEDAHGGIVRCLGLGFDGRANEATFALELMHEGSLDDVVRKRGPLGPHPRAAMCALRCLTNGLSYLHDVLGVVHRDVKPSNVLVDKEGAFKLCDFGLCERIGGIATEVRSPLSFDVKSSSESNMLGTIAYMSPERLVSSAGRCGPKSDVWSLGVTVLEAVLGRPIFNIEDGGPLGLVMQIVEDDIDVGGIVIDDDVASTTLRAALYACLRKRPEERVSTRELRGVDGVTLDGLGVDLHKYSCLDVQKFLYPDLSKVVAATSERSEDSDDSIF